jgi:hypothetical protein
LRELGLLAGFKQMGVDAGVVALGDFGAKQQGFVAAAVGIGAVPASTTAEMRPCSTTTSARVRFWS